MSSVDPERGDADGEHEQTPDDDSTAPTKIGVEGQELPLKSLTPQQLQQLGQQLRIEINQFMSTLQSMSVAGDRFRGSADCVNLLKKHCERTPTEKKKMLVPLSQSVYVDGFITKPDEVLVDVGTGYFCQKNVADASKFLNSKVEMLQENSSKVAALVKKKQAVLEEVTSMLMSYQKQMGEGAAPSAQ